MPASGLPHIACDAFLRELKGGTHTIVLESLSKFAVIGVLNVGRSSCMKL